MKKLCWVLPALVLLLGGCAQVGDTGVSEPTASSRPSPAPDSPSASPAPPSPASSATPEQTPSPTPSPSPNAAAKAADPDMPVGDCETPIHDYSRGRLENIRLAIQQLEGIVLEPGEEFSFNESVGRRTVDRGFKKAIIFKEDEKVKEVGGGICQVSTTLYQSALEAGLEITERHEHGEEVTYAEPGQDATVYFGTLDFRFRNTSGQPLKIHCALREKTVYCSLYPA